MSGLIWKDLLVLRRSVRVYLLLVVFYALMAVTGVWDESVFGGISALLVTILPLNCFSWDNLARWDTYALTLPLTRRQVVGARYLVTLLIAAAALVLTLGLGLLASLFNRELDLFSLGAGAVICLLAALILSAVLLPLLYRFGPEKARILLLVVIAAGVLAVLGMVSLAERQALPLPDAGLWMAASLPAAAVLMLAASFWLSCRIYGRKEG